MDKVFKSRRLVVFFLIGLSWLVGQPAFAEQDVVQLAEPVTKIACPLQQEVCTVSVADQQFDLRLTPHGLPSMTTLQLELMSKTAALSELSQFQAWFEGRDMDMGRQPLVLDNTVGANRIVAQGIIPMCHMDAGMVWLLNINFRYQNSDIRLLFEMSSDHTVKH